MEPLQEVKEKVGTSWESAPFQVDKEHQDTFEHGSYLTEMYGDDLEGEEGYPENLIEGFHLLSMIDPVNHGKIHAGKDLVGWNYGLNKVRFIRPAVLDTPYRSRSELAAATEKGDGLLLEMNVEIVDEADQPVMVAQWLSYLVPLKSEA